MSSSSQDELGLYAQPQFFHAGGVSQLSLRTGADLRHALGLSDKHFVVLAMPCNACREDAFLTRYLNLIDRDKDGRVRVQDLRHAMAFAQDCLNDLDALMDPTPRSALPMARIDDATPRGELLRDTARQVLANANKADAQVLSLNDVRHAYKLALRAPFNGDGVVELRVVENDPIVREAIELILETVGGVVSDADELGVDKRRVDEFFDALVGHLRSYESLDAQLLILGERTQPAFSALMDISDKLDDFFERCRVAAFLDEAGFETSAGDLNRTAALKDTLAVANSSKAAAADVKDMPLARPSVGGTLSVSSAHTNPAFRDQLEAFKARVLDPLHRIDPQAFPNGAELTEAQWNDIKQRFAPYKNWRVALSQNKTTKLPIQRVQALLRSEARQRIESLIAKDLEQRARVNALRDVELLVSTWCVLRVVMQNFISFQQLYDHQSALFLVGRVVIDARVADLVFAVDSDEGVAKHAFLAAKSNCFLVYLAATKLGVTRHVCAAITAGDGDGLYVGRRGVFYATDGSDWDAVCVRVVEQPLTLYEAAIWPYRRMGKSLDSLLVDRLQASLNTATGEISAKLDVGVVAAIGVGVGAISTAVASMLNSFFQLGWFMPLGFVGILVSISGPSMVTSFGNLRRRSIGPILEASGFAMNHNPTLSMYLCNRFTTQAADSLGTGSRAGRALLWFLALSTGAGLSIVFRDDLLQQFMPPQKNK